MTDILIICSPGGHLVEALDFTNHILYKKKFIISDYKNLNNIDNHISFINSERDLRILLQIILAFFLILKEKPRLMISTGAGVCVPFFILAKLFKIPSIYIESPTRIENPSMSAKIIQFFATKIYVRSPFLVRKLKNAIYVK